MNSSCSDPQAPVFGQNFGRNIIIVKASDPRLATLVQLLDSKTTQSAELTMYLNSKDLSARPKARDHLGTECAVLIYDIAHNFDANHFCALAGTLVGGGLLLLIISDGEFGYLSTRNQNAQLATEDNASKTIYSLSALKFRLLNTLLKQDDYSLFDEHSTDLIIQRLALYSTQQKIHAVPAFDPTQDQKQAVDMVEELYYSSRKRALFVEGGRGRGKSAVIGHALAAIIAKNSEVQQTAKVLVTAGTKSQTNTLLKHAFAAQESDKKSSSNELTAANETNNIEYLAIDHILTRQPEARLLVIEEAASIAVDTLLRLHKLYKRVIFSSTTYGYEGQGRGFEIRLLPKLNSNRFKRVKLTQPVRWPNNDLMEAWINEAFLLHCETEQLSFAENAKHVTQYKTLKHGELRDNENLLRQVFSLLVNAHYRTSPSDLERLLQDPKIRLQLATIDGQVAGVLLAVKEDSLTENQAKKLLMEHRKPRGNLTPQLLSRHFMDSRLAGLAYLRIHRIAVNSACRRQSVGSQLIRQVHNYCIEKKLVLSCSFSIESDLLKFWRHNHFNTLLLGRQPTAAGGQPSVLMIAPSTIGQNIPIGNLLNSAYRNIFHGRINQLTPMNSQAVLVLLKSTLIQESNPVYCVNDVEMNIYRQQLQAFSNGLLDWDGVINALIQIVDQKAYQLFIENTDLMTEHQHLLLVMVIFQRHGIEQVCQQLKLDNQHHVIDSLRKIGALMLRI